MAFVPAPESMFRNHDHHQDHPHFTSPSSYSCSPQDYQGVQQFLMRRTMSFSGMNQSEEVQPDDDMSDDGSQMLGEKKRRLNLEQVKALEKSFEIANKLEPERKMQLARALGLQPRQIAIWFQNRRARWKTKQLERDYDVLKRQFDAIKADNDVLKSQNKKLQAQLVAMKNRESSAPINLNKDNEGSWSNGSENSGENVKTSNENSNLYTHPSNKSSAVFPLTIGPTTANFTQLLHNSSRPDHPLQLFQKIEHTPVANEAFCNAMFGGIEETPEFWPWSEQQNFH